MPELSRERIVELSGMIVELIDVIDLDDDEADSVCEILLTKMWQRSGLDLLAFHAAVCAALPDPSAVPLPVQRH